MGTSFMVAALITIAPYFIYDGGKAIGWSVGLTLASLFLLGLGKGYLVQKGLVKSALEVFLVGVGSAGIGYLLGECMPIVLKNIIH